MPDLTNAQAALLAACTQFATSKAYVSPETVQGVAARYKGWLDRKDRDDEERDQCPACKATPCSCGTLRRPPTGTVEN